MKKAPESGVVVDLWKIKECFCFAGVLHIFAQKVCRKITTEGKHQKSEDYREFLIGEFHRQQSVEEQKENRKNGLQGKKQNDPF